ncbi:KAP family NTPase [Pseudoalteromonas sp. Cn5-37]|uniref:P-loop NTPase fold protein n=1 Tax=Pseudoalteromonas sp. Cn5-37 TaxID=2908886 RepID=UPI001F3F4AE1|nr:P-loop NTPase fold protein [Pseudoalteromonas sp. Cn5-37]MCF2917543.1 KAP family NTPase [Pseudoalteromonas sp. Cn5-37]
MDNDNNSYTFLIEKPSKEDLFHSGSHSRTADAVFKSLKNDNDINVVGIEGNLGSGKSTVLELIKCLSKEEQYEFVEFDVERFQHGATKKALIEKLYSAIESSVTSSDGKAKIEKAKNVALGNHFEYTSNIKSNVNIWIIWFTIALLAGVRLLPDALSGVGNFIQFVYQCFTDGFQVASNNFDVNGLSILSIFLAWFPYHIVRCAQKRKKILYFFGTPPTTGDIFKRNSKDTISETIEINKEVGAYELQEALEAFVFEIPENKRFILVLDNLDRVTNEKLREVWSDIEVFTSIAQTKIQLLIPYSIKHVASSLSSDEAEGMEFISKRIPISFRVAPILSADWKMSCSKMIEETGISVEGEELKGILSLIDLWTYANNTPVTPRFMKKLINSIVSLLSTHNEPIHTITAFYYQLSVQNYSLSSVEVLSSESKINDIKDKLKESKAIIERTIDFEIWSKEFVSIHYLSSYIVAESEILRAPLSRALNSEDIEPFIVKQNIYAYDKILLDLIDKEGTDKFISLMLKMKKTEDSTYITWVDKWFSHINIAIEKDSLEIKDIENLISSTQQLVKFGVEINRARIESYYKSINKKPDEFIGLDDVNGTLKLLYGCSQLLSNRTPIITKLFNAKMFIHYLWPNRSSFPNWQIEVRKLKESDIKEIFSVINEEHYIDKELLEEVSSRFRVGWLSEENVLLELYKEFPSVEKINAGALLESNIYAEEWYHSSLQNYYQRGLSFIEEESKTKWLAQAVANIIYHSTPQNINFYESHIELTDEFHNELANCLAVSCSFGKILSALENQMLSKYVTKAINILILNSRVQKLNIDAVIRKYTDLKTLNIEEDKLLHFLSGWMKSYGFTLSALEKMDELFLFDILNTNSSNEWRSKILELIDSGGEADVDWWIEQIEKPNSSIKLIVEWYVKNNKRFNKCGSLSGALNRFFTDLSVSKMESYSNKAWIGSLISILPKFSRRKLSRALNKLIGLPKTSVQEAECIIVNCDDYVELEHSMGSQEILVLFENIVSNQDVATWFDKQKINFEVWDGDSIASFVTEMIRLEGSGFVFNKALFPKSLNYLASL